MSGLPSTALMSPTASFPSSASSSASPTDSSSGNQSQGTPSSLYLFTFLTTLLLLLTVSFGIVLRSFVLRRRFRRRVEAAIAAGVLLPGSLNTGRGDRRFQEKPKLWEVWMDEEKAAKGTDGAAWGDIMPISAQVLTRSSASPLTVPLPPPPRTRSLLSHLPFRRPSPPPPLLPFYPPPPPADPPTPGGPDNVQVTVLIAMPSLSRGSDDGSSADRDLKGKGRAQGAEDEDEELPEVCFGTTEVVVRDIASLGLPQLSPASNANANGEESR
ncbi:hypothetical protein CALVIDRAFT_563229 [Calocera viscosa TUFC12733]|uniref:Uncharacterized protein n=1 Tax=Calocera viscosa (strain TUFC12733) TaxID=1330018 RepID=A0A167MRX6_CALVF|nr:hypothetical protein CALVIDRAFT_563229 [Calocera viscosa TUFC12733]